MATGGPHAPVCFCYGDLYEGAGVTEAVKTGWELKIIFISVLGCLYIKDFGLSPKQWQDTYVKETRGLEKDGEGLCHKHNARGQELAQQRPHQADTTPAVNCNF